MLRSVLTVSLVVLVCGSFARAEEPEPTVELIHAGREPRQKLRYNFTPGTREGLGVKLQYTMELALDGHDTVKAKLPATKMVFTLVNEKVTEKGDLHYRFTLRQVEVQERADLDPNAVQQMREEIEKLVGASGWAVVDSRGVTKSGHTLLPEGTERSIRETVENLDRQMRQLSAPLPEEPVGEGARWSHTAQVRIRGVKVDQTTTFKLMSLQDGKAFIKVRALQGAEPQRIRLPELPKGAIAELESLSSKAAGTLMLDFSTALPRLDADVDLTMEFSVRFQGQKANCRTRVGMLTSIYPVILPESTAGK